MRRAERMRRARAVAVLAMAAAAVLATVPADAQRRRNVDDSGTRAPAARSQSGATATGEGLALPNAASTATPADRGAAVYAAHCAHCHDRVPEGTALAMLPGPASLTLKYGGRISPYIKERPDLANAATLAVFLRNGTGSMPPFRKTEITDADIAAVAAYFAQTSSN